MRSRLYDCQKMATILEFDDKMGVDCGFFTVDIDESAFDYQTCNLAGIYIPQQQIELDAGMYHVRASAEVLRIWRVD